MLTLITLEKYELEITLADGLLDSSPSYLN